METSPKNKIKSYLIGVAIGDGNLSNPNGRAVRLRVSCDKKYPKLVDEIERNIKILLPKNKVSRINRTGCVDISCYSNSLEAILGWKAKDGSKAKQSARIPLWIRRNKTYTKECLRGLFQTDGSIYYDRGYKMLNFTTIIPELEKDVRESILKFGFKSYSRRVVFKGKFAYIIRISKNVDEFIETIGLWKE